MDRKGQSLVWGIGALLIAFGLYALLAGNNNQTLSEIQRGNYTLVYNNGSLANVTLFLNGESRTIDPGNFTVPRGDYVASVSCEGEICTHRYLLNPINRQLAIVYYMVGVVLLIFGILSFYMAHKA